MPLDGRIHPLDECLALHRSYASSRASAQRARRELKSWLEGQDIVDDELFEIVLAVGEALNNAATHGYRRDTSFSLHCERKNQTLHFRIVDQGGSAGSDDREFDRRDSCGLGVYLMRSLMDGVTCEFPASGAVVALWRTLTGSAHATRA